MSLSIPSLQELDEKQKKIIQALNQLKLKEKLENFVLAEKEKIERKDFVTGYPYWLTIDPVNYCNLKCPFCPTGQARNSRIRAILSFGNFKKIIDELGPYLIHIDFCNWGEPFLNRQLSEMIRYAEQYYVDTKVDTNLAFLTEDEAEKLILSGLDKIIVSIDGITPETYSRYRVGGDFNKVMQNLKILLKKKRELKRPNPYITWQFLVFRHNEHEIEEAKKIGRDLGVDHVGITRAFIGDKEWMPLNGEYSNYNCSGEEINGRLTSGYFKSPEHKLCNWPWEAIVINPNGSVSPCCSIEDEKDDFGNIFAQPFKEVWNNQSYRIARRYIKDKKLSPASERNVCIGCSHLGMINLDILSCHSLFNL